MWQERARSKRARENTRKTRVGSLRVRLARAFMCARNCERAKVRARKSHTCGKRVCTKNACATTRARKTCVRKKHVHANEHAHAKRKPAHARMHKQKVHVFMSAFPRARVSCARVSCVHVLREFRMYFTTFCARSMGTKGVSLSSLRAKRWDLSRDVRESGGGRNCV